MAQFKATIVKQSVVAENHLEMILDGPCLMDRTIPGQFVNVSCRVGGLDPLLRRPFSVYRQFPEAGRFSILYRVMGRGTQVLAGLDSGVDLDLLGPLGNGFDVVSVTQRSALVGGGVGVPPIYYLARSAIDRGFLPRIYLGFASRAVAICTSELASLGSDMYLTTVDGSAGEPGLVTQPLERDVRAGRVDRVYACGPRPMLAAVARLAEAHGVDAYLSLEERMGCGVGACLSCVCPTRGHDTAAAGVAYRRVCKEGPVFPAREVILGEF